MCGIVGIVGEHSKAYIKECTELLTHRGPDDSGIFSGQNLSLGHRRLSIQDLSPLGHQPMEDASGRYVIVFNGEIYNHWEIRKTLETKYKFISRSDTETILYGYMEYGVDLFNMLNGIFALAIYDTSTGDLIVVRDQFGVKPLYFYADANVFAFASEMKAFSSLPNIDLTICPEALCNYLHFLWSPGRLTPFAKILKLLPGHYIRCNAHQYNSNQKNQEIKPIAYYEIPFDGTRSTKSEGELIDELDALLYKAVERQLLSDVPVGFFLSGGLDSSGIVAMAKRILPEQKIRCYTIDYEGDSADGVVNDLHYAKAVAKHLKVELVVVKGKSDIVKDFDKMIYHLDEPQTDVAPLHVLNICIQARKDGHIVLLGGTAGDDLFSGYRRHQALAYEQMIQYMPLALRKLLKSSSSFIGKNRSAIARRTSKAFRNIHLPKTQRMAGYYGWIDEAINKSLFSDRFQEQLKNHHPNQVLLDALKNIPNEKDALNQMLYWDLKYFLVDHNLNYTDKLGMAVGVEIRVPFLDKELLEFSTKIPTELKMKGKTTKYLLKKVMERYLPHEVIYRPKSGFGGPVREWINNDLITWVDTELSEHNLRTYNIFSVKEVRKLVSDTRNGKLDAAYTVLGLISIQSFLKQFVYETA